MSQWVNIAPGLDGTPRRILPAYQVTRSALTGSVTVAVIWVTEINKMEGWVKWRTPNQPFDVERLAEFADVHSTLDAALEHVRRAAPDAQATLPANQLQ